MRLKRREFFKSCPPNPSIPEQTIMPFVPEYGLVKLSELQFHEVGRVLCDLRDAANFERSLRLADLLYNAPNTVDQDDAQSLKQHAEIVKVAASTWKDWVPEWFENLRLEAVRRGVVWDDQTQDEKERGRLRQQDLEALATRLAKAIQWCSLQPQQDKRRPSRDID